MVQLCLPPGPLARVRGGVGQRDEQKPALDVPNGHSAQRLLEARTRPSRELAHLAALRRERLRAGRQIPPTQLRTGAARRGFDAAPRVLVQVWTVDKPTAQLRAPTIVRPTRSPFRCVEAAGIVRSALSARGDASTSCAARGPPACDWRATFAFRA